MNIYAGNLSYEVTDNELQSIFSQYGEVVSARIITDSRTGRSKGFGFVEMKSGDEAQAAIDALNGTDYKGRKINVNEARAKEEGAGGAGPRRSFSGGPGGGGGRGRGPGGGGDYRGGGGRDGGRGGHGGGGGYGGGGGGGQRREGGSRGGQGRPNNGNRW